jgi:alkylation response protein AidB-like acyl-CoA dehydrogenase
VVLFADSEAQKLLRSTARSYLAERFPWERLYALERGEALAPDELRGLAERGWFALLAPESAGGAGASLLEAAAVVEEFGYAAVPAPVLVAHVAADLLAAAPGPAASDALQALASGDRLYTVAEGSRRRGPASEPGALPRVPFADICDAVLAPVEIGGGPAFALVPLAGAGKERVEMTDRASYFGVRLDGAAKGGTVLAHGDEAEQLHERCDALTTALAAVELAGMLRRTMEMTGDYISNRVQFGQPIAKFQAARHRAAELLMQTETARWTAYHALWRLQQDAADRDGVWLAKHWAVRAAARVFEISHLLHGGVGVGTEYPLHLLTQGIAAFAVRAGTMDEMVDRTIESITAAP